MGRSFFLLLLLVLFASLSEARRLHVAPHNNVATASSSRDTLFLNALPKGTVPSSAPSKKGHVIIVDEKLIARHLITVDRLLRSVPSPGAGH